MIETTQTTKQPSKRTTTFVQQYLRPHKKFPAVWCPGCGIGMVMGALIRAIDTLKIERDNIVIVSGIGCSSRMPVYLDINSIHTTHGRALSFATGLKIAKPKLHVIVIMGDGDAVAIGGNHFIHAARRNIELTAIVINNEIYGLTGGQRSPTTKIGTFTATTPFGNMDQSFDISQLAVMAGASFVAKGTVFHIQELQRYIMKALQKQGFGVVEALSYCHTNLGRRNKIKSHIDMLKWQKENVLPLKEEDKFKEGVIGRGILIDKDKPGFLAQYSKLIKMAQEQ